MSTGTGSETGLSVGDWQALKKKLPRIGTQIDVFLAINFTITLNICPNEH
ncbi:hypothetical protein GCM10026986_06030 [Nitrincola alkalisediminis]